MIVFDNYISKKEMEITDMLVSHSFLNGWVFNASDV